MNVDEFFAGFEISRQIFDELNEAVGSLGAIEMRISKSQVAYVRARPFAWAWIPDRYLHGKHAPLVLSMALLERDDWPRWKEIVEPKPGRFTHHLELFSPGEVDAELFGRLQMAWQAAAPESRGPYPSEAQSAA